MTLISDHKIVPAAAKPKPITYRQFLNDRTIDPHSEWVNGEAIPTAPISNEHQFVTAFLLSLMSTYVNHHKLGCVLYEPFQMKIGASFPGRAPDILFLAKANQKRLKKKQP